VSNETGGNIDGDRYFLRPRGLYYCGGVGFDYGAAFAEETIFPGKPEAVIDLGTKEGVALVKGEWRYHDTE